MSIGRRQLRMSRRALLAAAVLLLAATALGDGPRLPPAPADGLYDDASVFSESQHAAAVRAVGVARAAGVDLHIALYNFIVGETIEQRAERLKAAWCPDGPSLLVVADTSTNQCTYLSHVTDTEWLSTTELQRIFTESGAAAATTDGTSAEKILVVIENLAPRLSEAMARHHALTRHRISPRVWGIFAGMAGTALILAAAAWTCWLFLRRRQSTAPTPRYFPTVAVSERFGGPYGGGVIAEVNFGNEESPHPNAPTPP